jgi:hypothetical protein
MGDVVSLGTGTPVILTSQFVEALGRNAKAPCKVHVVPEGAKLQEGLKLLKGLDRLTWLPFPGLQRKNADLGVNFNSRETFLKPEAQAMKP